MVFQREDYNQFIGLLQKNPDWIPELRNLLLSQDFLALPEIVRTLVETQQKTELAIQNLIQAQERTESRLERLEQAQERTEARLDHLEAIVERLAQAQERTEARLNHLEAIVERLAQAQERTEARLNHLEAIVERLAQAQERTEARLNHLEAIVERLAQAQERTEYRLNHLEEIVERLAKAQEHSEQKLNQLDNQVASLRGQALEQKYCQRAAAYFGRLLKKVRVISSEVLAESLEELLSPEEFQDALLIDLVVQGRPRNTEESSEIWLAIEVSTVIDRNDVIRSRRRADLIQRQGIPTLAVVAGEDLTEGGEAQASREKVAVVQNGSVKFWQDAIALL
jgi:DNA repair exonuclease SbcCD ATPase subunit